MGKEIIEKLSKIQSELKAPKSQVNSFGNYKFRSCEDILEAVKPSLRKHGLVLTLSDDVVMLGDRVYVKAYATLHDGVSKYDVTAFARETEDKKGMDKAQITGAASSYARKYALNGLFAIDDTKDADTMNGTQKEVEYISEADQHEVADLIAQAGANQAKVLKYAGAESLDKITRSNFPKIILALDAKIKKAGGK